MKPNHRSLDDRLLSIVFLAFALLCSGAMWHDAAGTRAGTAASTHA